MLSFVTYKDAIQQVEIIADETGIDELIQYLQFVKKSKDHMHLIIDSELDPIEIKGDRINKTHYAKHVRIEYLKAGSEEDADL